MKNYAKSAYLCLVMAVVSVSALAAKAAGTITLPDTGVDVPGLIGTAITALGVIVVAALGGYVGFLLVRKAMRWIGKALG